jgi:hypothetical protein
MKNPFKLKLPVWAIAAIITVFVAAGAGAAMFVNLTADTLAVSGAETHKGAETHSGTVTFSGTVNGAGITNNTNPTVLGTLALQNATTSGTVTLNGPVVRNGAMTGTGTVVISNTVTISDILTMGKVIQLYNGDSPTTCSGATYGSFYMDHSVGMPCFCNGTIYVEFKDAVTACQ